MATALRTTYAPPHFPAFIQSREAPSSPSKIFHHPGVALHGRLGNRNMLTIVRWNPPAGLKVSQLQEWMGVASQVYI